MSSKPKVSFALCLALIGISCANAAADGEKPAEWVQIGETRDTVLQIDANSLYGFESSGLGAAHRVDYRFKGKTDEKLTSTPRTAFMAQTDCDAGEGTVTMFVVDADGEPSGAGDTYKFKLDGESFPDAIARALCKARSLMMENAEVVDPSK